MVADQTLGDLVYLESHFDRFRPTVSENWREKDVPGNGITYDLGSHLIDQVVLLFGKPDSIFSDIQKQRKKTPLQTIILIFHSSIPPSKLG
ncbi:Gfo/Idh/MocA family oxidoreductase [Algoriphagus boritolerans]|uniref:Gfo/Idh/MocA family protein n=1 Tax=Algoriphagus boritolerans TaxID=308111 RepID=UPI002FCDFA2B